MTSRTSGGSYWRLSPRIWYKPWDDDTKLLALYLLTCEHRTLEGLFRLPKEYIEADLQWLPQRLAKPFAELLEDGFIEYDENSSVILLVKALKYQRPDNPNQVTRGIRILSGLPDTPLFAGLLRSAERYAEGFAKGLREWLPERFAEGFAKPQALNSSSSSMVKPFRDSHSLIAGADDTDVSESAHSADFAAWWEAYGRIGSKADAAALYRHWRQQGAGKDDLLAAAKAYREHCAASDCKMAHARTFLARKPNRWREWASGERHGDMDVRATERLADVFDTAAEAFGLNGGHDDNGSRRELTGGPARAAERRAHAGGGVPALELASGE